jgi:hypothetical protein
MTISAAHAATFDDSANVRTAREMLLSANGDSLGTAQAPV